MMNWIHVAAIVRLDDLRLDESLPDFDAIFGKEVLYNDLYNNIDDINAHPEKYLPVGSEGTLQKSIWINPDTSSMAAYTVSIFGDLRNYSNPQEIVDWFKSKVESPDLLVRDAVISVSWDPGQKITWSL